MKDVAAAYEEKIKKLIIAMNEEFNKNDPHEDMPFKRLGINHVYNPWTEESSWEICCYAIGNGIHGDNSIMVMVRDKPIAKEDFDERCMPADLIAILKDDNLNPNDYPNIISGKVEVDTLEEAINKMRKKIELFQYGYSFMDEDFYLDEYLYPGEGDWMK